jgi:hypothetical protein
VSRTPAAIVLAIAALTPDAAFAQVSAPGPYVIELRGAMSGAPGAASFYPPVSTTLTIPRRAFGFSAGAHIYTLRLGVARLGLGVDVMRSRGTASTPASASMTSSTTTTTTTATATAPSGTLTAAMTVTSVAPQVSFNFGTHDGWSYLSGGYGTTMTNAEVNIPSSAGGEGAASRDLRMSTINYGGGARWFLRERLAFGFDVRFHRLRATHGVPSTQIVGLSVGLSLR